MSRIGDTPAQGAGQAGPRAAATPHGPKTGGWMPSAAIPAKFTQRMQSHKDMT
jgi:hypothetical protein